MPQEQLDSQLHRLVLGLADQEIKRGTTFSYDGGELYADEVAEICLQSILCLAQAMSTHLGIGSFGYEFGMAEPNPVFPLHGNLCQGAAQFFEIAPFITQVFDAKVMDCRHDLVLLFEAAARTLQPDFSLASNVHYATTQAG